MLFDKKEETSTLAFARNARPAGIALLLIASYCVSARAQEDDQDQSIRRYISVAWATLTRSTDDCKSYEDSKVTSKSTLYLPADFVADATFEAFEERCQVNVLRLPHVIGRLDDVPVSSLGQSGLLYLPKPYIVPGGRFNEMYGWDSYFIELGLLANGRPDLAKDILENFLFEVEHYGGVLNANRSYYLSRSQPPFLAEMILDYKRQTRDHKNADSDEKWLGRAYRDAKFAYELWADPRHRAGGTGLSRYADYESGPVPEMADDDQYYAKALRWLAEHPSEHPDYLAPQSNGSTHEPQLSDEFFQGDRADRESGFDTTFRFGPFAGSTHHFAPVCLNSLLYRYERDMATIADILRRREEAKRWRERAKRRKRAMNAFLWSTKERRFVDYDFVGKRQSNYVYVTSLYPLWAGLATPAQARLSSRLLNELELAHGVQMSTTTSGLQWDAPFGWAPCNWIVVDGLRRYGFKDSAERIALKFTHMVEINYAKEGTIREKYNVGNGTTSVLVSSGYQQNVTGFGWTNGVYLAMKQLLQSQIYPRHERRLESARRALPHW